MTQCSGHVLWHVVFAIFAAGAAEAFVSGQSSEAKALNLERDYIHRGAGICDSDGTLQTKDHPPALMKSNTTLAKCVSVCNSITTCRAFDFVLVVSRRTCALRFDNYAEAFKATYKLLGQGFTFQRTPVAHACHTSLYVNPVFRKPPLSPTGVQCGRKPPLGVHAPGPPRYEGYDYNNSSSIPQNLCWDPSAGYPPTLTNDGVATAVECRDLCSRVQANSSLGDPLHCLGYEWYPSRCKLRMIASSKLWRGRPPGYRIDNGSVFMHACLPSSVRVCLPSSVRVCLPSYLHTHTHIHTHTHTRAHIHMRWRVKPNVLLWCRGLCSLLFPANRQLPGSNRELDPSKYMDSFAVLVVHSHCIA